jgi:5-methylcytosine-specific restriction endonuclease McrA
MKIKGRKSNYLRSLGKSQAWQNTRLQILNRDNFRCRVCGSEKNLQVHHKNYSNGGADCQNLSDLIALCADCHKLEHKIKKIKQ